jgi:hypothetical protein
MRIKFIIFTANYDYCQEYLQNGQVFEVYIAHIYKTMFLYFELLLQYFL